VELPSYGTRRRTISLTPEKGKEKAQSGRENHSANDGYPPMRDRAD